MALTDAIGRFNSLINTVGRIGINSLYPNDFEVYVIAFELVDSLGNTLEFFSFPINPTNISITEPEITNIKKTARGVVSLKSDSFIPKDITLTGNFGRNFKIIVRDQVVDFTSFKGALGVIKSNFNGPTIKTGYGTTKVFQNLLEGSKALDSKGNPIKLYFYNFAFGENYVVEVMDKTFTQARDSSNMIWNYNVSLKAVAPINGSNLASKRSLLGIVAANTLQKNITSLSSDVQRYMSKSKSSLSNKLIK